MEFMFYADRKVGNHMSSRKKSNTPNIDRREIISWIIKLGVSVILIYFVLTDGGKSSISEVFNFSNSTSAGGLLGSDTIGNIAVLILLAVYVFMLFRDIYMRLTNKPKKTFRKTRNDRL